MTGIRSVSWRRRVGSGIELMSMAQLRQKALDHSLTDPQRLDFHLLLFIEKGTGSHMVDFQIHKCRRGTVIHVSPNQVHAFGDCGSTDATLLIFRPELLPTDFYGPDSRIYPPAEYVWPPVTQLNQASIEFAMATVGFLENQQTSHGVWAQPEAVRHIVAGLASFAFRSAKSSDPMCESQSHPLFFAFLSQVEQSYSTRRDARWYARQADCSYRTLSRICSVACGETPKTIIDQRVATEARRLLAFTGDSANSIGATLGFTDPTNFVKFFQRVAGETPDTFRRHWRN